MSSTYQDILPYSQDRGVGFQVHAAASSYNFQALDCDVFSISQAQAYQIQHCNKSREEEEEQGKRLQDRKNKGKKKTKNKNWLSYNLQLYWHI